MTVLTAGQVYQYALGAGFTSAEAEQAVIISFMESGWNPSAVNNASVSGKWGPAVGLMQVRSLKDPPSSGVDSMRNASSLTDPSYNMKAAKAIYDSQGWTGWSTYSHVTAQDSTYQTALSQATKSAASSTGAQDVSWYNPFTWGGSNSIQSQVQGVTGTVSALLPAVNDFDTILKHIIDPKWWLRVGYVYAGFSIISLGFLFILFSNKTVGAGAKKVVKGAADTAAVAA